MPAESDQQTHTALHWSPALLVESADELSRFAALKGSSETNEFVAIEGRHVILRGRIDQFLELNDPAGLGRRFDEIYDLLADFTGFQPYQGNSIVIQEVEAMPGAAARAGSVITCLPWVLKSASHQFEKGDACNFNLIHELGHDFDRPAWNWHPEFFANIKAAYVVERLQAKAFPWGSKAVDYTKPDGVRFLEAWGEKARKRGTTQRIVWSKRKPYGELEYHFMVLQERFGWEPFRKTFHAMNSLSNAPGSTPEMKLARFTKVLGENAGEDLRPWLAQRGFPVDGIVTAQLTPQSAAPEEDSDAVQENENQGQRLKELREFLDQGLISKEAYEAKKKEILDSM